MADTQAQAPKPEATATTIPTPKGVNIKNLLVYLLVGVILVAVAGFLGWSFFVDVKEKAVAGLSYYDFPIVVEVNDQTLNVEAYGNYSTTVTTDQPITVVVKDTDGNVLLERTHDVTRLAGVAIDIVAPADNEFAEQCFFEADVTDVYYIEEGNVALDDDLGTLKHPQHLVTEPAAFYYHEFGQFGTLDEMYLYPGKYAGDDLPRTVDEDAKVIGIYPTACADLEDEQTLLELVNFWRYFEEEMSSGTYNTDTTLDELDLNVNDIEI